MAGSLNRVQLLGNCGADPEIRSVGDGRVANLRIATSESWRDKNTGEKKEKTQWHSIVVWNDGLIGIIEKYVSKGSKIMVEGQLETRKWQDQEGNDRYSTEVVLSGFNGSLLLLGDAGGNGGSRNDRQDDRQESRSQGRSQSNSGGNQGSGGGNFSRDLDDEIPF